MQNLKIRVNSEAESKEAQELFVKLGYKDRKNWTQRNPIHESIQAWSDGEFTFSLNHNEVPALFEEITLPELRAMAKPKMKEYLIPDRNYEYILTDSRDGLEPHAKDWIEIPEGAEVATICRNYIIFWKDEKYSFSISEENKWCYKSCDDSRYFSLGEYMNEYGDVSIIWQREQDEPFLTPECTLNDQYAEKDNVNHPSHYTQGKVECIDALESATIGKSGIEAVCVANIIKYLWRYEEKNGLEDVKKAQFYLNRLIATLEK